MTTPSRVRASAFGVALAVLLAACGSSDGSAPRSSSSSRSTSTTTSPSTTTSTTTLGSTTTTPPPSGPAAVSTLRAVAGGGSGEIEVSWNGVAGATAYRVGRSISPGGPFTTVADVSAATGTGSHDPSVVNLFLDHGRYVLVDVPAGSPDHRWYYRVTASGSGGDAPPSAVVCGAPPGSSCP